MQREVNFAPNLFVEPPVTYEPKSMNGAAQPRQKPEHPGTSGSASFSFGARHYPSHGPRRLFVPQKCLIPPAYEIETAQSRSILRIVSRCQ
jgi:hypothetical protein